MNTKNKLIDELAKTAQGDHRSLPLDRALEMAEALATVAIEDSDQLLWSSLEAHLAAEALQAIHFRQHDWKERARAHIGGLALADERIAEMRCRIQQFADSLNGEQTARRVIRGQIEAILAAADDGGPCGPDGRP